MGSLSFLHPVRWPGVATEDPEQLAAGNGGGGSGRERSSSGASNSGVSLLERRDSGSLERRGSSGRTRCSKVWSARNGLLEVK